MYTDSGTRRERRENKQNTNMVSISWSPRRPKGYQKEAQSRPKKSKMSSKDDQMRSTNHNTIYTKAKYSQTPDPPSYSGRLVYSSVTTNISFTSRPLHGGASGVVYILFMCICFVICCCPLSACRGSFPLLGPTLGFSVSLWVTNLFCLTPHRCQSKYYTSARQNPQLYNTKYYTDTRHSPNYVVLNTIQILDKAPTI